MFAKDTTNESNHRWDTFVSSLLLFFFLMLNGIINNSKIGYFKVKDIGHI